MLVIVFCPFVLLFCLLYFSKDVGRVKCSGVCDVFDAGVEGVDVCVEYVFYSAFGVVGDGHGDCVV